MKGHISNRSLAAYIADTMDESARERFGDHLAGCGRCRARHEALLSAVSPFYAAMQPHASVRARVISTRDALERGSGAPPAGLPFRLSPRVMGAAALGLAAALAVALVFLLTLSSPRPDTRPSLVALEAGEGVTIGEGPLLKGARVLESSVIVVPDTAAARFAYGEGFSMTLSGPSVMRIDRLTRSAQSGRVVLECTLGQGLLVSRAEGNAVSYAYTTPGARVEPSGTEFLLQASGEDTLILMKSGAVRVRSARTGETVAVRAGSRCEVMDRVRVSKGTAEEMRIFGLTGSIARPRGLRLLPVLPLRGAMMPGQHRMNEKSRQKPHLKKRLHEGEAARETGRVEGRVERLDSSGRMRDRYDRRGSVTVDNKRDSARDRRGDRPARKRSRRTMSR